MTSGVAPPLSKIYIPAFDALRGAAVLAVVLYHLSDYCPTNTVLAQNIRTVLRAGWCGVDLFFVLSGFLITGILLDTRNAAHYFRAFYARRVLRIFPVYYATLIVVLTAAHFWPALSSVLPPVHDRIFYFFYLNNWWVLMQAAWGANVIGHFWSLAVEEQFYLVWPLAVKRLSGRRVEIVAVAGIVLALVIRIGVYLRWGAVRDIVENPFCRMDSLLMGALLAVLVRRAIRPTRWISVVYGLSLCAGAALLIGSFSDLLIFRLARSSLFISSALTLAFGGLVLRAFLNNGAWRISVLRFLGKYSYGMYVYHVPLLWLVVHDLTNSKPTLTLGRFFLLSAGVVALTVVAAKLSFDCFEILFLKQKARFAS